MERREQKKYYCVAIGHVRGVFETWDSKRYEKYPGAI